jgi:hypothetical protein
VQNSLLVFGGFLFFNFDCSLDVLDLRQNIHLFLSFLTFFGRSAFLNIFISFRFWDFFRKEVVAEFFPK